MSILESIAKLAEAARIIQEVRTELILCEKYEAAIFLLESCNTIALIADDLESGAL